MKTMFIKSTIFTAIAAMLFFAVYYATNFALFSVLFDIAIIATVFCLLAFIFCLIFKKEINHSKDENKD